MPRILFLGTCASVTLTDDTVSFIVEDDQRVLVDVGPTIPRQILRSGISPIDLDVIVMTHCHGDHIAGFPYLMFMIFSQCEQLGIEKTIKVLAPPALLVLLQAMLRGCYPPGRFPGVSIEWIELVPHSPYRTLSGMFIEAFPVDHTVENVGLRFTLTNGHVIVYSSDTRICDALVTQATDCDVLIQEAFCASSMNELAKETGHSSTVDVNKLISLIGCKQIYLVHYLPVYASQPRLLSDEIDYNVSLAQSLMTVKV